MTVLAAAPRGGLLHAPDLYMEKIVVGPKSKHVVDLDAPVADNLAAIAKCLNRRIGGSRGGRARARAARRSHPADPRDRARIQLIGDGDLSAGIAAAVVGTGVHAVMGTGGAPRAC